VITAEGNVEPSSEIFASPVRRLAMSVQNLVSALDPLVIQAKALKPAGASVA